MACNPEVLKHVPLFALLDDDELAVLAAQVELKRFAQPPDVDSIDVGRLRQRGRGQILYVQPGYAFRAASIKLGLTRSAMVSGLMPVISRNQTFSPRAKSAASMVA